MEGLSAATITAQDSSSDDSSCAALAESLPLPLFLSLLLVLPFSLSVLRSLDLLGPCPSLLPPFAQHSALMWPFFLQLKHSMSRLLAFFFLLASALKASSWVLFSLRRTCFSYSLVADLITAAGVMSLLLTLQDDVRASIGLL